MAFQNSIRHRKLEIGRRFNKQSENGGPKKSMKTASNPNKTGYKKNRNELKFVQRPFRSSTPSQNRSYGPLTTENILILFYINRVRHEVPLAGGLFEAQCKANCFVATLQPSSQLRFKFWAPRTRLRYRSWAPRFDVVRTQTPQISSRRRDSTTGINRYISMPCQNDTKCNSASKYSKLSQRQTATKQE